MRAGEFPDGAHVLRAKIDMASPNMNLRDPVHLPHPARARTTAPATRGASIRCTTTRTPSRTRSRASRTRSARSSSRTTGRSTTGCSTTCRCRATPQQIEFARLNLTYTVMSKRKLLAAGAGRARRAAGTTRACRRIAGLRRRGYTPEAIRDFCERDRRRQARQHGRRRAARARRARRPQPRARRARWPCCGRCKVVIENYPEGQVEELDAVNNPEDPSPGTRKVPFSRVLYIERTTSARMPPKKFFRLSPGPRGAAALRLLHHVHRRREGRERARSSSCAAPTTRRRAAATRPTAAR